MGTMGRAWGGCEWVETGGSKRAITFRPQNERRPTHKQLGAHHDTERTGGATTLGVHKPKVPADVYEAAIRALPRNALFECG